MVGKLILDEQSNQESRGRFLDLFIPGRRRLTLQVSNLHCKFLLSSYGQVTMPLLS